MKQRLFALALALGLIVLVILPTGASPITVMQTIFSGAFGGFDSFARMLATLAPLALCASGLIFTFKAGLYNLGVEGQITLGAIAATAVLRWMQPGIVEGETPAALGWMAAIVAGMLAGVAWGVLIGALNIWGRISEIFAGLGLNFMAQGLAIYLIFGPWKRPGIASMSGTQPFDEKLWLPAIGITVASPIALILGGLALIVTIIVIGNTHFGLRLRAVGSNLRSSFVLGIPATQHLIGAFAICGALAGLAGALQVLAIYHNLIPSISSGLGFLALMVVMLINFNPWLVLPVAAFFSILNIGALRLPSDLKLESALSGVIQGLLVLAMLFGRGWAQQKK